MLTERDARSKICPHLPVDTTTEEADGMQVTRVKNYPTCWAGQCAMWRWHESAQFKADADAEFAKSGKRLSPTEGYCGLAGPHT